MQLQRTKNQRLQNLDVGIENNKRLAQSMKNHDMGITPVAIDTRSTFEKQQDNLFIEHELRRKVYNIFNNDPQFSEQFIDLFKKENIGYAQFENVYDQLIKQFKSTLSNPKMVFDTMKKLIYNLEKTGVSTSTVIPSLTNGNIQKYLTEVKQMIEDQYTKGNVDKKEGDDMVDKVDSLKYIFSDENVNMELFKDFKKGLSKRLGINEIIQDIAETLISNKTQNEKFEEFKEQLFNLKKNTIHNLEKLSLEEENKKLRKINKNDDKIKQNGLRIDALKRLLGSKEKQFVENEGEEEEKHDGKKYQPEENEKKANKYYDDKTKRDDFNSNRDNTINRKEIEGLLNEMKDDTEIKRLNFLHDSLNEHLKNKKILKSNVKKLFRKINLLNSKYDVVKDKRTAEAKKLKNEIDNIDYEITNTEESIDLIEDQLYIIQKEIEDNTTRFKL